jgi:hypothetical protein
MACDDLDEADRRTAKARRKVRYWRKRALAAEKKMAEGTKRQAMNGAISSNSNGR